MLKDPDFIKKVLIKDFDHFINRDNSHDIEIDRLFDKSIVNLRDQKWRNMRTMLSPIYTSSKMKTLFGLLNDCMEEFVTIYECKAKANCGSVEIDTHEVFARVTADGIATTALGFEGDCVKNENSEIYKIAKFLEVDFKNPLILTLKFMFPSSFKLLKLLKIQIFRKSIHEFFLVNVMDEIQRRQDGKISRPDVIQLLVAAKKGQLKLETGDDDEFNFLGAMVENTAEFTDEDLVSQAMAFFLGGFGTTAVNMQAIAFELAINPEVQQTLIDEVDEMLEELNGKTISYDQLNGMKFLEMVVNESLRKWPVFRVTIRSCNKDYQLIDDTTGDSYSIHKGTVLAIPIGAIQMDPKYFPDPEKFDPYRFSDENIASIQSGTYLPFSSGPRFCIGNRYALLKAKLFLFNILTRFRIETCSKTPAKISPGMGPTGFNEQIVVAFSLRK
jgi:cytochrome P450 family 9